MPESYEIDGLARMFAAYSSGAGQNLEVFHELRHAEAWLGLQSDTRPPCLRMTVPSCRFELRQHQLDAGDRERRRAVMNPPPISPCAHQSGFAKGAQMVRHE